ncbi:MAG: ABC transporter permease [Actinomycetes bacterium]
MARFLTVRIGLLLVSLVGASLLVFTVLAVLPGSPAQVILGTQATPASVRQLTIQLGLDKPLWQQYLQWVGGLASARLGSSYISHQPIGAQLVQALQVTGPLVLLSLVVGVVVAVPAGMVGALRHGRLAGTVIGVLSQIGVAIPTFVGGIVLIILVAVKAHLLPSGGFPGWAEPGQSLRSLVLPAITLGLVEGAILTRYIRTAVMEVLASDYLRTARAKGLSLGKAMRRHGLRNVLPPIVTVLGLEFAGLIIGAIVVENVFTLPGIGTLLLSAVQNRDLIVVEDIVMLVSGVVMLVNLLVDLSYRFLDPRMVRRT